MKIREWQTKVHALAVAKGWWTGVDRRNVDVIVGKLALVHSEISEALEELRVTHVTELGFVRYEESGKPQSFAHELADAVIRIMDLCEALGIDLQRAIEEKHAFNTTRSHRHGGKAL